MAKHMEHLTAYQVTAMKPMNHQVNQVPMKDKATMNHQVNQVPMSSRAMAHGKAWAVMGDGRHETIAKIRCDGYTHHHIET